MGAVSSIIFAKRNIDKTANGDIGRAPIPVFQALSATAGVATLAKSAGFTKLDKGMTSIFGATDKVIEKSGVTKKICDGIDKVFGKSDELLKKTTSSSEKICLGAGKMVNGLLVGASAIRVLRDEDKESALIEEGLAMSSMFAGEAVVKKIAEEVIPNSIKNASPVALKADLASCKTIVKNMNTKNFKGVLKSLSKNPACKGAGKIFVDLVLVTASILCFDLGKKIGKKITGREDKKDVNPVKAVVKQPMQPLVKSLTVKA